MLSCEHRPLMIRETREPVFEVLSGIAAQHQDFHLYSSTPNSIVSVPFYVQRLFLVPICMNPNVCRQ